MSEQLAPELAIAAEEIDAVTREMADQAEIAYQILSEALGLTPEQMSELTLTDLADAAAARLEDQPPPADVAIQPGARDAAQGPYTIISDPRHATGIYETIEDARSHAESLARRSTFGRSAIVSVVAEVELVPQWSDAK